MHTSSLKKFASVSLTILAIFSTSSLYARPVACEIDIKGYAPYKGTCEFKPSTNGSFDLVNIKETAHLFKDVMLVGVDVQSPGAGEAVVIYYAGPKAIKNNMVTTPVKRSTKNQSCWVGEDIRVCAK